MNHEIQKKECTAIVVRETANDHTADTTEGRETGSSQRYARKLAKGDLAYELIALTEGMEVRHGKRHGQSHAFVRLDSEFDDNGSQGWIGIKDNAFDVAIRALGYRRLGRGPTRTVVEEVTAHIE